MRKPIYPVLFAVFPALCLYAYNIDETPFADLLLPLFISVAGTLLLFFVLRLFVKDYNKVAIITSLALVLFFSYGHIRNLIFSSPDVTISLTKNLFMVSLWGVLLVASIAIVVKAQRNFIIHTRVLNVMAIALVAIALINMGICQFRLPQNIPEEIGVNELISPSNPPDIYYIILDGYTRQDVLMEDFGYDNSEFIDGLAGRGFYVASSSNGTYGSTLYCLAMSQNMRYLEEEEMGANNLPVIANKVMDSKVSRLLKSCGYQYIFLPTNANWKGAGKYATVCLHRGAFGIGVTEFAYGLIETTALSPFARFFSSHGADTIIEAFNALANMPDIKEPTFVFAHITCPHPPWLFDSDGVKEFNVFETEDRVSGYLDNLAFVNGELEVLVDELILESDTPPIIILQSDHGTGFKSGEKWGYTQEILNAYYLPDGGDKALYETISPVNTFRVIFNYYFGADYKILEDEKP